jgi:hypothetical protein
MLRQIARATIVCVLSLAFAHAEVTRLEITSKRPYGTFAAGDYVFMDGKVHGEISRSELIPGLDKAAPNARGKIAYSARVVLIIPSNPAKGNGTLLVDVPNRGNAYASTLYNSPRDEPYTSGTFEQGTGFLQDRGFALAEVYWEYAKGADLPSFIADDGKTRYVEGVGFAIFRDTADFLANASTDAAGNANPLRGTVKHTLASGKSQSGRFLKSLLLNGFNKIGPRLVFEGMHIFVSGPASLPIMQTTAGPDSSANAIPTFDNPEANEDPLMAVADLVKTLQGRGETPPKMFLVNSTTDFFSRRASLARTGLAGTADVALPANVRMYDIAGAPHVILPKAPASCTHPQGRLDWTPVSRALLLRLESWVANGTEPPASRLMPLEPAGSDEAVKAPARFPQAVVQVPRRDEDGNALGGVRLPELVAPLGTHGGLNEPHSRACMLIGAYRPFALTKAERESSSDRRLSVAERYKDRDEYVTRIRGAAKELIENGFMLAEDAAVIIQAAASSTAFPKRTAVAQ